MANRRLREIIRLEERVNELRILIGEVVLCKWEEIPDTGYVSVRMHHKVLQRLQKEMLASDERKYLDQKDKV